MEQKGKVQPHQASRQEVTTIRAIIERDLDDAALVELSDDRRFATAYNAALQTSKMAIACAGYRVSGAGHHQTTFEATVLALGPEASAYAAYFEMCRRKRNMLDYDLSGVATETEVNDIIREAETFLDVVEHWIDEHHSSLSRLAS